MSVPSVQPIKLKEYEVRQSKYNVVGKLPIRSVLLGPSGSGKTILLQNMILDIYKGLWERVYIFSPSIHVDHSWEHVKTFLNKTIQISDDEPPLFYDNYDPESLSEIIETQKKITTHQKNKDTKTLFQIRIVIDDFADSPEFSRNSKLLHSLFTRGRHSQISTIVATQKFTAIHPIIRVNASELYVFRLRNHSDLQTFLDELGGLVGDKKTLHEMYSIATNKPFAFLYCKLSEKNKNDIFYVNYDQKLTIE